jgi:hypothetical protein
MIADEIGVTKAAVYHQYNSTRAERAQPAGSAPGHRDRRGRRGPMTSSRHGRP